MKPAAHGTKHCQRYRPLPGARKVKEIVSCALLSEQGAWPQGFLALSETPGSGTDTPSWGIANVCAGASGLTARTALPLSIITPPTVPATSDRKGLRRPVELSYW